MIPTPRRVVGMSTLALAAVILAGCSSGAATATSDDGSGPIELPRVGTINGYPQIPVAIAEGYLDEEFQQEGATLTPSPVVSANDGISALRTGNVDMVVTGYDPAGLVGIDDVVMVSLVEASPETTRIVVAEDSEFESIEDLEGQIVGSYNSTPNAILVGALTSAGLTTDDIEYIPVENDVAASTLASGAIAAWMTFDPAAATAELSGIAREIATGEDFGHLNPIVLYTTRSYLESNRDSVVAMVRAFDSATDWIVENQADGPVAEIMAEATGLPVEVAQRSLDHREYQIAPVEGEALEWMIDFSERAQAVGTITEVPDLEALLDPSVYEDALG
jgi:ABC-type nitrate/sulfonate/bicarbonate transport system substrate-binding protein